MGGDLHYFGPKDLDTNLANLDLETALVQHISASAKREMEEGGNFECSEMVELSNTNKNKVAPIVLQA